MEILKKIVTIQIALFVSFLAQPTCIYFIITIYKKLVHDVVIVVWKKCPPPFYSSLFRVFSKFEGKWTKKWRRRLKSFFADICDHLCNQNGQSDSNFRHHKVFHYFSLLYFSWFDIKCQRIFFICKNLKAKASSLSILILVNFLILTSPFAESFSSI